MSEPSAFLLKEIVSLIEERLPGGRHVSTAVLTLIVLVLVTGCVTYLRQYAIIPIAHAVVWVISGREQLGTTVTIIEKLAQLAVWIVVFYIVEIVGRVVGKIVDIQEKGIEVLWQSDWPKKNAIIEAWATLHQFAA